MKHAFTLSVLLAACAAAPLVSSPAAAQDSDAPAPSSAPSSAPPSAPAPGDGPEETTGSVSQADHPAGEPKEPKEDDLGLEWVWLNADLGFSYSDLKSAKLAISPAGGTPITVVDTTSAGLAYGFGAGIRLLFLTLGLRARNHSAMNLWQIDAEVGLHGRIGRFDPYLAGRFGYDTVGTLSQSVEVAGSSVTPPQVSVHGWNGGLALGLDYYFAHAFSVGAEAAGDVIFLTRPPATPPALTAAQQAAINNDTTGQAKANYQKLQDAYQASASSVGFGGGLTLHVGLHF